MWGFYQSPEAYCQESSTATEESTTNAVAVEYTESTNRAPELKKDWSFYGGMAVLILAAVLPVFSLAIPWLGLPTAWAITLAACFIAGGPEVLLVVAAALLGKETVQYFLAAAKNWFLKNLSIRPVCRS